MESAEATKAAPASGLALTMLQPWATLTAMGLRTYETRSWSTPHRGRLLIHASSSPGGIDWARGCPDLVAFLERHGIALDALPMRAVVGEAVLEDIVSIHDVDHGDPRPFGWFCDAPLVWRFANAQRYAEPIPAKGLPGVWKWRPEAELAGPAIPGFARS